MIAHNVSVWLLCRLFYATILLGNPPKGNHGRAVAQFLNVSRWWNPEDILDLCIAVHVDTGSGVTQ